MEDDLDEDGNLDNFGNGSTEKNKGGGEGPDPSPDPGSMRENVPD